jgi:hypothetical protein
MILGATHAAVAAAARISAATWITADPLVRPVLVHPSDTAVDAVDAAVPLQIP